MKKYFVCLAICLSMIISVTGAFAAKFSFDIPKELDVDILETYMNGEHPMLPLRSIAEGLGFKVTWNDEEMSVTVADDNLSIKIYIGIDSYNFESADGRIITAPVTVGIGPELKDCKTYVPAVMINMLRFYDKMSAQDVSLQ